MLKRAENKAAAFHGFGLSSDFFISLFTDFTIKTFASVCTSICDFMKHLNV